MLQLPKPRAKAKCNKTASSHNILQWLEPLSVPWCEHYVSTLFPPLDMLVCAEVKCKRFNLRVVRLLICVMATQKVTLKPPEKTQSKHWIRYGVPLWKQNTTFLLKQHARNAEVLWPHRGDGFHFIFINDVLPVKLRCSLHVPSFPHWPWPLTNNITMMGRKFHPTRTI